MIANLLPLPLKILPKPEENLLPTRLDRFVGTGQRPPHRWYVGIELEINQKRVFGDEGIGLLYKNCSD
jgi:hypothetical protein